MDEQKIDEMDRYMVLESYELIISYYYYRLTSPANQN